MPPASALLLGLLANPWPHHATETVEARFSVPPGTKRIALPAGHFGAFLRQLPVHPGTGVVKLFDGRDKRRQDVHRAVIDIDIGGRDLQQCADFAYRLHAEWSRATDHELCYRFTSGDPARWSDWKEGLRPRVKGRKVEWERRAEPRADYSNFRRWLDSVFSYAGSASLHRDTRRPRGPVQPGDIYVQPGFPGHVVVVLDVAQNPEKKRFMLLGQSYMPAQSPHVLRGPVAGAWYPSTDGPLNTPEWSFPARARRRFPPQMCR